MLMPDRRHRVAVAWRSAAYRRRFPSSAVGAVPPVREWPAGAATASSRVVYNLNPDWRFTLPAAHQGMKVLLEVRRGAAGRHGLPRAA
ncbi:hypothetical protein [Saccharothrix deserti]|uniref:hypothetical protein n=1 Tax=Saccharothrix deserti TaxID=2593674 RepID=UPI00131BB7AD|nr:hypothetical protein [Saccharothrix deserti]